MKNTFKKVVSSLVVLGFLSGCVAQPIVWHGNTTQQQFIRDDYECKMLTKAPYDRSIGATIALEMQAKKDYQRCMESRGYSR